MSVKYGDQNRLLSWKQSWRFDANDVVIERLLVSNVSALPSDAARRALEAAPRFLSVDFEDYQVIGISVCPMPVGETIRDTKIDTPGQYLLDVVFRLSGWTYENVDNGKQEAAASIALQEKGFAGLSVPVVTLIDVQNISLFTSDELAPARDFWSLQPGLLIQRGGQPPALTDAFQVGYVKKTWGKQLAFGLADYPDTLEPFVVGSLVTPTPDGGNGPAPLFTWPGGKTAQAPSTNNLLVWGVFAAGGFLLAREAWRALRG